MTKEELIAAAREAIERWNSNPKMAGEPRFMLIKNRAILGDFPIPYKCLGFDGGKFIYSVCAQATLDYYAGLGRNLEIPALQSTH